jgi:hypothetical protein
MILFEAEHVGVEGEGLILVFYEDAVEFDFHDVEKLTNPLMARFFEIANFRRRVSP